MACAPHSLRQLARLLQCSDVQDLLQASSESVVRGLVRGTAGSVAGVQQDPAGVWDQLLDAALSRRGRSLVALAISVAARSSAGVLAECLERAESGAAAAAAPGPVAALIAAVAAAPQDARDALGELLARCSGAAAREAVGALSRGGDANARQQQQQQQPGSGGTCCATPRQQPQRSPLRVVSLPLSLPLPQPAHLGGDATCCDSPTAGLSASGGPAACMPSSHTPCGVNRRVLTPRGGSGRSSSNAAASGRHTGTVPAPQQEPPPLAAGTLAAAGKGTPPPAGAPPLALPPLALPEWAVQLARESELRSLVFELVGCASAGAACGAARGVAQSVARGLVGARDQFAAAFHAARPAQLHSLASVAVSVVSYMALSPHVALAL
ncbi:hypothetical protein FOA52_006260 [Chlamydomonas sp. UWO 241]|nr:hypothetical protein FOA52_006260 [Chlamydomonas sp. UWO 241]